MARFPGAFNKNGSTRTRLRREVQLVPVEFIRPTEELLESEFQKIKFSPICLVMYRDGFLYIVDGNHRFYQKVFSERDCSKIPGWILREGDQNRLMGPLIPTILQEWRAGVFTLDQLARKAFSAWHEIKTNTTLTPTINQTTDDSISVNQLEIDNTWPGRNKFALIIRIIQGEISIEEASQEHSLPKKLIESWVHRSLRAMMNELKYRSDDLGEK